MENKSEIECPYCRSTETFEYYSAKLPTILSACARELAEKTPVEDIKVNFCSECGLGFQTTKLQSLPEIYANYLYISPCSGIGTSKYVDIIRDVEEFVSKNESILEIGCSEGYLLHQLKKRDYDHLTGIEPSRRAIFAQDELKLNVFHGFFNDKVCIGNKMDVVIMMHVWEHLDAPFDCVNHIRNILSDNGKLIIEVPNFNGYIHQHLFYYSEPFLRRLCYESGFKILKLYVGDVLRVICQKDVNPDRPDKKKLRRQIEEYKKRANKEQERFLSDIKRIEKFLTHNDEPVYWWGAGSTSVIYLSQIKTANLRHIIIILDSDKDKIGKFIPGSLLPVTEWQVIKNKNINKLIVASEFIGEIKEKMAEENISCRELLHIC